MRISPSLIMKIVAPDSKNVSVTKHMLTHARNLINKCPVCAAKIKDSKLLSIKFDLCMIASNTLVFDNDIVIELATNAHHRFFDAVDTLPTLRQSNSQLRVWESRSGWHIGGTTLIVRRSWLIGR